MTATRATTANVYKALHAQIIRVDALRHRLDLRVPGNVLEEFLMRRKLTMAAERFEKGDVGAVLRWAFILQQVGN